MAKIETKVESNNGVATSTPDTKGLSGKFTFDYAALGAWAIEKRWQLGIGAAVVLFCYWMLFTGAPRGNAHQFVGGYPAPMASGFVPGTAPVYPVTAPVGLQPQAGSRTFTVASAKRSGAKVYINSLPDYRTPGNQSIVLIGEAAGVAAEAIIGRKVTGSGSVTGNTVTVTRLADLRID